MRAHARFDLGAEQLAHEVFQRAFQVRYAHLPIDIKPFELVELAQMRGVHFIPPIGCSRSDYSDRWRSRQHRTSLYRGGMGTQQPAVEKIKSIGFIPSRMIRRSIQSIKTIPLRINVRPSSQSESQ